MRLIVLTLTKDARRLWPVVMLSWLILATLAYADRWRADWSVSPTEGWLNLLLPAVWACLAALLVLQDPLVGDRHFWMTRPLRWPALLAAKLILVVAAIHVPLFLADVYVLVARGFALSPYLFGLLAKQVLFFAAVILPAIALATLVRSFTHFVVFLFAIGAGMAVITGGPWALPSLDPQLSDFRDTALLLVLAATAAAITCVQYAFRLGSRVRIAAGCGALAATAVYCYLPLEVEYAAAGSDTGVPSVTVRTAGADESVRRAAWSESRETMMIPISIGPVDEGVHYRIPYIEVELVMSDGTHIRSKRARSDLLSDEVDLMAYPHITSQDGPADWILLYISDTAWSRLQGAQVQIRGWMALDFYRYGETVTMGTRDVGASSEIGRCTSGPVRGGVVGPMLKVLCESPRSLPQISVTLRHEPSGEIWSERINSSFTYRPGPNRSWLSPLHRGQSFFHLTDSVERAPGSRWNVPAEYLNSSRIEITPEIMTGHAISYFDFGEVPLTRWLAEP